MEALGIMFCAVALVPKAQGSELPLRQILDIGDIQVNEKLRCSLRKLRKSRTCSLSHFIIYEL